MATTSMRPAGQTAPDRNGAQTVGVDNSYDTLQEHTTETRRSFATSEFWLFVVLSAALVLFGYESGGDSFARDDAWRYVTWLGVGYLVSRGLAKAGSYESYQRGGRR
jgi:hypothetical protein